jgi:hypothetical protein
MRDCTAVVEAHGQMVTERSLARRLRYNRNRYGRRGSVRNGTLHQTKGGWTFPAAKVRLKATKTIVKSDELLFLLGFRFLLFCLLCHGVAPLLKTLTLTSSRFVRKRMALFRFIPNQQMTFGIVAHRGSHFLS